MDHIHGHQSDESSPLLRNENSKDSSTATVHELYDDSSSWTRNLRSQAAVHWAHWQVCYICGALVILIDIGGFICYPAMLRMTEAAVCRRYYLLHNPLLVDFSDDVPELQCKLDPIQEELAKITGWSAALAAILGVIVAMPWGVLADKKGRRFVTSLGILGLLLRQVWGYVVCYFYNVLPPRALLAGSLFTIIGGGSTVLMGVMWGMVADACTPDLRAQVLFYIQAAALISEVSGLPIGSALLKKNGYWMPALLGLSISTLSCVLLIWLPTVSKKTNHHIAGGVEEITETSRTGLSEGDTSPHSPKSSIQPHQSLGKRLLRSIKSRSAGIVEVLKLVFTNPTLCIGFLSLAATNGIVSVTSFLPQFVSKRFGWTIGDASLLTTIKASVAIFHLLILLPYLTHLLKSRLRISGPPLDLRLAHLSIPFLIIGSFLMFLITSSPALFIIAIMFYTLGTGFRGALESFLASLVRPDEMATLYVAVSVVDTMGEGIVDVAFAAIYGVGLKKGHRDDNRGGGRNDFYLGLPFLFASLLFAVSGILSGFLRVKKAEGDEEWVEGETSVIVSAPPREIRES